MMPSYHNPLAVPLDLAIRLASAAYWHGVGHSEEPDESYVADLFEKAGYSLECKHFVEGIEGHCDWCGKTRTEHGG